MAQQAYPEVVALEAFENGDALAIHQQLKLVAEHHAPRTRKFAFDAATAVARGTLLRASGTPCCIARLLVFEEAEGGCRRAPWALRGPFGGGGRGHLL